MRKTSIIAFLSAVGLAALVLACAHAAYAPSSGESAAGWIDATATLDPATTPVYAGDAPMTFEFLMDMRRGDRHTLSKYSLGAHSGTHIDAPMHFIAGGAPIDRIPLDRLIGPARVIEIPDDVQAI